MASERPRGITPSAGLEREIDKKYEIPSRGAMKVSVRKQHR